MSVDSLLDRLARVRRMGSTRWVARCPAHDDRYPSLAIRETDNDRVLLHCFAGCAVENVLSAVELGWDAVFPPRRIDQRVPRERRPLDAMSVLTCVANEAALVSLAADNLPNGMHISDQDRDRLRQGSVRLQAAEEIAIG